MTYDPASPYGSPDQIEAAIAAQDWNTARRWLQQLAYSMVGPEVTAADKARFTSVMKDFAQGDPAYRRITNLVLPIVRERPGVKQSEFTRGLEPEQTELVSYALYFAAELGELKRENSGSSYKLFEP